MTNDELQVLRNITREYIRKIRYERGMTDDTIPSIVCVNAALEVLREHNFKQDNPII